jgi:ATP-dependent DNA helicase RecG
MYYIVKDGRCDDRMPDKQNRAPAAGAAADETGSARYSREADLTRLAAPVTALPGVGKAYAEKLSGLGISSIGDLVYHFPRRYLDRSNVTPISSIKVGQELTVVGTVKELENRRTRNRKSLLVATIFDGTGYLSGVWFNQEYHAARLGKGTLVAFSGKVRFEYSRLQIVNPSFDVLAQPEAGSESQLEAIHTGRIIPLYPGTAGVTSAMLRRLISRALEVLGEVPDPLPEWVRSDFELQPLAASLFEVHFPSGAEALKNARYRALFDEIFTMQVGLALTKKRRERERTGIAHGTPGELVQGFVDSLPFDLTGAQRRAWREISGDMEGGVQMNRLLQGEVGSGKTVVAVLAMLLAVEGGYQAAMMAPTEVLANQHYDRISKMLAETPVSVALLTGDSDTSVTEAAATGETDVIVGTHALIQSSVTFNRLGLVVVDEQHRFGLTQRVALARKGLAPDVLYMSATPIPRSLALTLYGDLDVSVIQELPVGRKGVITVVADEEQRQGAFAMVRNEVEKGRQAFVVCPLVEGSEKLEARAAREEATRLAVEFPCLRIGVLHGQMKSEEKRRVMRDFEAGEVDILVSTLVVEVGVDVPNATVMIVENADRFGLSQLHQLRGRVGRGEERGVFVLFAKPTTEEAKARLDAIRRFEDGFALAEADLGIRGEGTLFGTRQSGLPDLRLTRLPRNIELVRRARVAAFKLVESDPDMKKPEHELLGWEVNRRFGGALEWLFQS